MQPKPQPEISVVVPTYNRERLLRLTLDGVLGQTFLDWECVVVDDGSKDDTAGLVLDYARRDPRFRYLHQENGGQASAWNTGLGSLSASSRYVSLLDSDDLWEPTALEALFAAVEAQPETVGAHGCAFYIDGEGQRTRHGELETCCRRRLFYDGKQAAPCTDDRNGSFGMFLISNSIAAPGVALLRRSVIAMVGPADQYTAPAQDWDLWLRMARHGDWAFVDQDLLGYRVHGSNLSNNEVRMRRASLRVRYKAFYAPENSRQHKDALRGALRIWWRHQAKERWNDTRDAVLKGEVRKSGKFLAFAVMNTLQYLRGRPVKA